MNEETQKMNDIIGLETIITGVETMCVEKKNNDKEFMLEFQTTPKNSKEYNYRLHKWDCKDQLDLVEYLKKTSYNFK